MIRRRFKSTAYVELLDAHTLHMQNAEYVTYVADHTHIQNWTEEVSQKYDLWSTPFARGTADHHAEIAPDTS